MTEHTTIEMKSYHDIYFEQYNDGYNNFYSSGFYQDYYGDKPEHFLTNEKRIEIRKELIKNSIEHNKNLEKYREEWHNEKHHYYWGHGLTEKETNYNFTSRVYTYTNYGTRGVVYDKPVKSVLNPHIYCIGCIFAICDHYNTVCGCARFGNIPTYDIDLDDMHNEETLYCNCKYNGFVAIGDIDEYIKYLDDKFQTLKWNCNNIIIGIEIMSGSDQLSKIIQQLKIMAKNIDEIDEIYLRGDDSNEW